MTLYPPPEDFSSEAHVPSLDAYRALYKRAEEDPESFWADIAQREIHWFEPWTKVLDPRASLSAAQTTSC